MNHVLETRRSFIKASLKADKY